MKKILIPFLTFFAMCKSPNPKNGPPENQFYGSFTGIQNGYTTTADITVNGNQVTGTLIMNGLNATLSGAANGTMCAGTIVDATDGKQYKYTGNITGNLLKLLITSPDKNGQQIEMVMSRKSKNDSNPNPTPNPDPQPTPESSGKLDSRLFGEWISTEILGAGTEFSMTNETLMEFLEDGTALSWPGRSVAPDYTRDEDKSKASKGKWYTDGDEIHLTDPTTGQDRHSHA